MSSTIRTMDNGEGQSPSSQEGLLPFRAFVESQQPRCRQRGIKLETLQSSGVCDPRGIRKSACWLYARASTALGSLLVGTNDISEEMKNMAEKSKEELKMPRHVAIILDGNGRWAKSKGLPRNMGHAEGARTVEVICEEAYRMGIQYLTVYAFSTENWNRPKDEVDALMKLLRNYMKTCLKTAEKNRMCVRVLGEKSRLDPDIRTRIQELEEATKNNDGLHFQIAINYGGRDEIVRAVRRIGQEIHKGTLAPQEISEQLLSEYLDTHDIPEPDLLIRTCNEQRISNFLLWQLAYTEFYVTPVAWPDFDKQELVKAVEAYNQRDRRYGRVSEENSGK